MTWSLNKAFAAFSPVLASFLGSYPTSAKRHLLGISPANVLHGGLVRNSFAQLIVALIE